MSRMKTIVNEQSKASFIISQKKHSIYAVYAKLQLG